MNKIRIISMKTLECLQTTVIEAALKIILWGMVMQILITPYLLLKDKKKTLNF